MDIVYIINISAMVCEVIINVSLLIAVGVGFDLKEPINRWFFMFVLLNFLYIVPEIAVALMEGYTGLFVSVAIHLADYFGYIISTLALLAYAQYVYEYVSTRVKITNVLVRIFGIYGVGSILLATIAQFNQMYVRFDENNYYQAQETFWISLIFPILAMLTNGVFALYYRKDLKINEWVSILAYSVISLIAFAIEIVFSGVWMERFAAVFVVVFIFINLQVEFKHRMKAQEAELAEKRIAIMLSQIGPHFLYNTLGTIDELFYENPEAAHKAIFDFSSFLRGNMDSLTKKDLIPFETELEHTKQYLRLEKLRFEERLKVVYDIRHSSFMLPAVTLQPIVENAVRYGVTKKRAGGTITIQTEKTPSSHQIIITDDGAGFDFQKLPEDGRGHVGISNVQGRLEAMCGGTLRIESEINKGTTVTIDIPK